MRDLPTPAGPAAEAPHLAAERGRVGHGPAITAAGSPGAPALGSHGLGLVLVLVLNASGPAFR
jgi:hypothetical protein